MPSPFQIRPVELTDMQSIARLMEDLGFDHSHEEVERRWRLASDRQTNPALLAVEGLQAVGLVALHIAPLLFYPNPVARITSLVVVSTKRRQGIGTALISEGVQLAQDAGCDAIELTTGHQRKDAHVFYQALGFQDTALRMKRIL